MKRCPKCSTEYDSDVNFCEKCGTKLVQEGVCPKCGKEVSDSASFCPHCGASLKEEEIVQEVVEPGHEHKEYSDPQLETYRIELENLNRRKGNFTLAGGINIAIGVLIFIISIINLTMNIEYVGVVIASYILMVISILNINLGIVFLVIAAAVFNRRIANRERILNQHSH